VMIAGGGGVTRGKRRRELEVLRGGVCRNRKRVCITLEACWGGKGSAGESRLREEALGMKGVRVRPQDVNQIKNR